MFSALTYLNGFGNEFESEAPGYEGSLPDGPINPQKCKNNLFAEQLSGSAFTAPRHANKRSWLYRVAPSVGHGRFRSETGLMFKYGNGVREPNQMRWLPFYNKDLPNKKDDFIDGIETLALSDCDGSATASSVAIHIYLFNSNKTRRCLMNSDGDFLIVPQRGTLLITTEFGLLRVEPNEIVVIQQGMKFSVMGENVHSDDYMRGYILEVKGNHFELPNLGPIGANGLANPRDFQVPKAHMVDKQQLRGNWEIVLKFQNELFSAKQARSPYDVAAWFGNYTPYKYNLNNFVTMNSVSVDHPDPSIFTVLTCPSHGKPGTALADFVIFPPRWECARDTFRPPYYHRNCMTEFMGLIKGQYQAKGKKFAPGGGSLHQAMIPHGPDLESYQAGINQDTSKPARVADDTMAFMFETSLTLKLTLWAVQENVDKDYQSCWLGLDKLSEKNDDH